MTYLAVFLCAKEKRGARQGRPFFVSICRSYLEVRFTRHTGEGNDITDVGHTGDVVDQPLESEAKARVRYGDVTP